MHAITKLAPLVLAAAAAGGTLCLQGCQDIQVDPSGGGVPPAGVIRGTVTYNGPPPCSQNGHIVGNAVILVFDARNPPPPGGLGVTASNFGVVAGDALFKNWPVTQGPTKVCPDASAGNYFATSTYAISPMDPGQYVIQGFFDYTGDFFATFKFRQLPEATDVGGGYLDITAAQAIYTDPTMIPYVDDSGAPVTDGGGYFLTQAAQSDPNYSPSFLPVSIGTPGPASPLSLRSIPSFTMPTEGYLADNVPVLLAAKLPLARPYFYPTGVDPAGLPNAMPLAAIVANLPSSDRPAKTATVKGIPAIPASATGQNPDGNIDFIPVLSFPQDIAIYAAPNAGPLTTELAVAPQVLQQYQSAFPQVQLNAGMPLAEQKVASDTISTSNPFHMQLGLPPASFPGQAPGGNGGIYVWWNVCDGLPGCDTQHDDFIPEGPGLVYRMWPLVVLAKLNDMPPGQTTQGASNAADPESLNAQGADLQKPIVIIQGITLFGDAFVGTTIEAGQLAGIPDPLIAPDYVHNTNLQPHVTVMLRPSTLCLDPRAPDQGGTLVAPGALSTEKGVPAGTPQFDSTGNLIGAYPPADTKETSPAIVVAAANLTNPQLSTLVNHATAGSTNGLMGGCLPMGRYSINLVYPTGQAWTTPNETGSCASAEGTTLFSGSGTSTTSPPGFPDPFLNGCSAISPRPVLYSQGTRAVVEITAAQNPNNCKSANPQDGTIPATPFVCTSLCSDPSLDPTATPPCSTTLAAAAAKAKAAAARDAGP